MDSNVFHYVPPLKGGYQVNNTPSKDVVTLYHRAAKAQEISDNNDCNL
jgi:hypothetical protein